MKITLKPKNRQEKRMSDTNEPEQLPQRVLAQLDYSIATTAASLALTLDTDEESVLNALHLLGDAVERFAGKPPVYRRKST